MDFIKKHVKLMDKIFYILTLIGLSMTLFIVILYLIFSVVYYKLIYETWSSSSFLIYASLFTMFVIVTYAIYYDLKAMIRSGIFSKTNKTKQR
jgi:hypothetical protein